MIAGPETKYAPVEGGPPLRKRRKRREKEHYQSNCDWMTVQWIDIQWEGSGLDQVGKYNGQVIVRVDPEFYRPNELHCLLGNNHKAKEKLSWQPKVGFEELVKIMIKEDIEIIKKNEEVLNFRN